MVTIYFVRTALTDLVEVLLSKYVMDNIYAEQIVPYQFSYADVIFLKVNLGRHRRKGADGSLKWDLGWRIGTAKRLYLFFRMNCSF